MRINKKNKINYTKFIITPDYTQTTPRLHQTTPDYTQTTPDYTRLKQYIIPDLFRFTTTPYSSISILNILELIGLAPFSKQ